MRISQTGTTQTAGARNKGGNFTGQLCISVAIQIVKKIITWDAHKYVADDLSV